MYPADEIFADLVRPHLKILYRLAYRLTGNSHDAEDLIQDLLFKAYGRLDELRAIEKRRAWLARVLYNQFIDNRRRNSRSPLHLAVDHSADEGDFLGELGMDRSGPETEVIRETEQQLILGALSRLPDDQRNIVILADIEGFTLAEMETIVDCPQGTLKSRLHRARARLRELLQSRL